MKIPGCPADGAVDSRTMRLQANAGAALDRRPLCATDGLFILWHPAVEGQGSSLKNKGLGLSYGASTEAAASSLAVCEELLLQPRRSPKGERHHRGADPMQGVTGCSRVSKRESAANPSMPSACGGKHLCAPNLRKHCEEGKVRLAVSGRADSPHSWLIGPRDRISEGRRSFRRIRTRFLPRQQHRGPAWLQ
jgi:hypothetical protein